MRMHDRLMTETPQPYGADLPFTQYARVFDEAQVIDATEVMSLFFEMERKVMASEIGEGLLIDKEVWFAQRFCEFDWSGLTMNMPPFGEFVMEFDAEKSLIDTREKAGLPHWDDGKSMGQMAVSCIAVDVQVYMGMMREGLSHLNQDVRDTYTELMTLPDVKWILCMSMFSQRPVQPIIGPVVSFSLPVRADGTMILRPDGAPVSLIAPADALRGEDESLRMVNASKYLYLSVIPALMAVNFMHTPQGEKGYHVRVPCKPAKNPNKHHQRKHFRPLTSWHQLDITPLREQFQRTLGRNPLSSSEFAKAMHIVRGNTATYAPNTYFGKPHAEPITVFRPSHRRGDINAGRVDKDYRLDTEGAS